jgi:FdhD protein
MRTPGDELAHVAGFCLGEGIVDSPDDIDGIHFSNDHNTNVITLKLNHKKTEQIYKYSDKTQYINNITEPICGSEFIKDLPLSLNPIGKNHVVEIEKSLKLLANLSQHQPLREKTRSAHAAAIYDEQYNLLSIAEDVGRHNAVDKAVGKLFLTKNLNQGVFLVLSSRISYELVQKAARAKIPIILAISKPTSLAVSLASELHMTLASQAKGGGLLIFCGKHRFCNNLQ